MLLVFQATLCADDGVDRLFDWALEFVFGECFGLLLSSSSTVATVQFGADGSHTRERSIAGCVLRQYTEINIELDDDLGGARISRG